MVDDALSRSLKSTMPPAIAMPRFIAPLLFWVKLLNSLFTERIHRLVRVARGEV